MAPKFGRLRGKLLNVKAMFSRNQYLKESKAEEKVRLREMHDRVTLLSQLGSQKQAIKEITLKLEVGFETQFNSFTIAAQDELTCNICIEILHDPLTLTDCQHTFCGFCLKAWLLRQHRNALDIRLPSNMNAYTCPTCRSDIRGVHHNPIISGFSRAFTTKYLEGGRTAEELRELSALYSPGDDVLPHGQKFMSPSDGAKEEKVAWDRRRLCKSE